MPFSGSAYPFTAGTMFAANEIGAVYGLFSLRAGTYYCLYVGQTDNLRRRLSEHLNNPPVVGVTHVFVEVHTNSRQRNAREAALIAEFQPPGNTVGRR